ncbi:MAG: phasin family protein [Pseudomonadota bacterium]
MPRTRKPPQTSASYAPALPNAAQAWMDITLCSARFAMDRMQADVTAQREMMACTSPDALMQIQIRYCQKAAQDYTEQAARMVEMMGAAAAQTVQGGSPFARKYDDVPV